MQLFPVFFLPKSAFFFQSNRGVLAALAEAFSRQRFPSFSYQRKKNRVEIA
jgi:hypothetical protein